MAEFERYQRTNPPAPKGPFVTVHKRGNISFNRSAFELLGEPEALELLFSKPDRIIGLKAAPPGEPYAFAVKAAPGRNPGSRPSSYRVNCRSFVRHYGIDHSVSRRYEAEPREDGILAVDLKRGGVEVSPAEARERKAPGDGSAGER